MSKNLHFLLSPNGYIYRRKETFGQHRLDSIEKGLASKKKDYKPERILTLPSREEFIKKLRQHAK
jgi:hypothetical protein